MKKLAHTILFLVVILTTQGQDLINPYSLSSSVQLEDFQSPIGGFLPTSDFLFTPYARNILQSGGYTGEYMIILDEHPWYINPVFRNLAKTFTVEVVSFPFTIPCWDQPTNCAVPLYGNLNERILMMPDDFYNPVTSKWNHLNRKFDGVFQNTGNKISESGLLITKQFIMGTTQPIYTFIGGFYPHTILKHTIYLHCTSSTTSQIIDSLTFYYDNTRGRMRWYPFQIDNNVSNGSPSAWWDVLFRPEVLVDRITATPGYDYAHTSNTDWIDGGTIDYFPFSQSNTTCGNYNPTVTSSFAKSFLQNPYNTLKERASIYEHVFNPEVMDKKVGISETICSSGHFSWCLFSVN
jgi:hypothetical protein